MLFLACVGLVEELSVNKPVIASSTTEVNPDILALNEELVENEPIVTPQKKKRGNKEEWIRSKRKKLRSLGAEYLTTTGKIHPARSMKDPCTKKCPYKCLEKIPYDIYDIMSNFQSLLEFWRF